VTRVWKHESSCTPLFCLKRVMFSSPFGLNAEHVLKREGDPSSSLRRGCRRARSVRVKKSEAYCAVFSGPWLLTVPSVRYPVSCHVFLLDLFPSGFHQKNEVWVAFTIIFAATISSLATRAQTRTCSRSHHLPCGWAIWVPPGW
jgi:hypothetical protein